MTIHAEHPFADPEDRRDPVRRLRGRLVAPVTLWTAPGPAGLPVSSVLVVAGEPGRVLGVLDAESDLWAAIEEGRRFAVAPLAPAHRQLADRFAGVIPAPGGPFTGSQWRETDYGPILADTGTWAGCTLDAARPYGWGLLVEATIAHVELGAEPPLAYHRGRYRELA